MAKRKTPSKSGRKGKPRKPPRAAAKRRTGRAKSAPKPVPLKTPLRRQAARRPPLRPVARTVQRTKSKIGINAYDKDLDRNPANYQPLTPITFLERAAKVFPERTAIIHGATRTNYADFYARSRRLASALVQKGVRRGDTVSAMMTNSPGMLELHYGVPMTGAVLNTLNTRLDAAALAFMLDHGEAKILITDREFAPVVKQTLALARTKPVVIDYDDPEFPQDGEKLGALEYEALLAGGDPEFAWMGPRDEWDAISLNYTSGTTGNPKGVVFHHRGAALMGYGNVIAANMPRHPVYLWTVPMFHCNGWCFPWTLSVVAGTHVCLRWVRAKAIYDALADHRVTHLCGAPIVMSTLINAPAHERRALSHAVQFITAAAPPPEQVLAQMAEAGFNVTHVYGLTETYGPAVVNEWKESWDTLERGERAAKKARQGVRYHALDALTVMDPETMEPVPADGQTMGEVMFRGNIVMKGYLKNPSATREAFAGGWFHSGDLGVMHGDGYVQLKDRSKDIIISGGENISSIEVEDTLLKHPAVMFAAVVARPDEKWGETPCAFIERKPGHEGVSDSDLIAHCRANLAHYKCPRHVVFVELPKTSTGKVQKFKLREMAKAVAQY
ncbi:MAG: acyl-CoA synthetase [Alphaproteobacteria bacterium]|nr:acyl-CoA synthetase [Alphaproteobacteria bacterium]MBV9693998.1 acyl-CoA synthetase [Alphaproteobacteria bacterium]